METISARIRASRGQGWTALVNDESWRRGEGRVTHEPSDDVHNRIVSVSSPQGVREFLYTGFTDVARYDARFERKRGSSSPRHLRSGRRIQRLKPKAVATCATRVAERSCLVPVGVPS